MHLSGRVRRGWRLGRSITLALITPLLEKNPCKTRTISRCHVPVVLSMSRVIVILFAAAMLVQIRRAGVAGWPEATLCIAIVLAIPLLAALERVNPKDALAFGRSLIDRFGRGDVRAVASVYATEPSKYDDHTDDSVPPARPVRRRAA